MALDLPPASELGTRCCLGDPEPRVWQRQPVGPGLEQGFLLLFSPASCCPRPSRFSPRLGPFAGQTPLGLEPKE